MKNHQLIFTACLAIVVFASCNHITYTPRSKKNIQREKPPVLMLARMVDYRLETGDWPVSKQHFMSLGEKYASVFEGFPYTETGFKIIDSNRMVFWFSRHVKDIENYKITEKIDLNSYGGEVKFYKQDGQFLWKLKMY